MTTDRKQWDRAGEKAQAKQDRKIIVSGDKDWSIGGSLTNQNPKDCELANLEGIVNTPKLPNEVLEAAFQEVVGEVQEAIAVTPEEVPAEQTAPPVGPTPSYKYHRPAQRKSFNIPMPKSIDATLLEDLPGSWEKTCFVGGFDYVAVEGQAFKSRVRRPGFKTGDHITLIDMTFIPGIGAMYGFKEGTRGSYCVRPDQVSFELPKMAENPGGTDSVAPVESIQAEVENAAVDGHNTEVQ